MSGNPVTVLAMIILAAFVIDRIVAALLFLLSFSPAWTKRFPELVTIENTDERRNVRKKQQLIYFVFASILALIFLISFREVGVLKALGFETRQSPTASSLAATTAASAPTPPTIEPRGRSTGDFMLTWLILIGGAENIARLLKGHGEFGAKSESQPIEITGKLTLEDRSDRSR